ncbi:M23 family metallopeptidase [Arenimonas sp.]|uniref:M23 family metallopeptidase n=1 Tax=Arenimonas sp. TaxID=1872635 RepID=UPI0035B26710
MKALLPLLALLALPAFSAELAQLSVHRQGQEQVAVAANRSGGPLEVELLADHWQGMDSEPGLPQRRVLAPGEQATLARLWPVADGARHELRLLAVPGPPHATPRDVVYSLPVEESGFELGQGFHGGFSHGDEANRYAVDLIVSEGTPVLTARDGVVVATMSGHAEGGADRALADQANYVRVLHEDGSMALYAHLQEGGVTVRTGDRVHLGQVLGYAGSTGFSSGPHLHFAVQVNGGMRLVSVPFRMIGPDGYLPLKN